MSGRKPMGPRLVERLDGSTQAKERMTVILETIAGVRTVRDACDRLGIEEAMFFRLRAQALQASVDRLEPRPAGRPVRDLSPEEREIAELRQRLLEKDVELKAAEVRLEIARAAPQLFQESTPKKTTARKPSGNERRKNRKRNLR